MKGRSAPPRPPSLGPSALAGDDKSGTGGQPSPEPGAPLTLADYPLAEKRPDLVRSRSGKAMADVTLEAVLAGEVTMKDLRIDAAALRRQAEIARAAGRPTLALNFERGADLVAVPEDAIMRAYDMLRPGRAKAKADLLALAAELRAAYGAAAVAAFIEEAAEVYDKRGLFKFRF